MCFDLRDAFVQLLLHHVRDGWRQLAFKRSSDVVIDGARLCSAVQGGRATFARTHCSNDLFADALVEEFVTNEQSEMVDLVQLNHKFVPVGSSSLRRSAIFIDRASFGISHSFRSAMSVVAF